MLNSDWITPKRRDFLIIKTKVYEYLDVVKNNEYNHCWLMCVCVCIIYQLYYGAS